MSKIVSFALLERALTSAHYPKLFTGEGTHEPARDLIAQLAPHTQDKAFLTAIVRSGLPPHYDGDTLEEVSSMVDGAVRKGFDQPRLKKPKSMSSLLLDLVSASALEVFHDSDRRGYISVQQPNGGLLNLRLGSGQADHWIRAILYRATGQSVSSNTLNDVVNTLQARAYFEGAERNVAIRIGRHADQIYFDLGRANTKLVRIDKDGWRLTTDSPIRFWRPIGLGELPEPERGGDLHALQKLLQLSDKAWHLMLAFILNCLRPGGPYMCLLIDGEQGSGKSIIGTVIKKTVDPGLMDKMRPPRLDRDLMIQAKDNYLLVYDNASGITNDISDALCVLATGGGLGVRKNYTDEELHVLKNCRPFIINGIGDFVHRPDLLERAIILSLPSMPEVVRRTERSLFDEFGSILPSMLGCLFDAASMALRNEDAFGQESTKNRMADAALFIKAAEPATGLPAGTLLRAIEESQTASVVDRIQNDPLMIVLEQIIVDTPFEGRMVELFKLVRDRVERPDQYFPKTPAHLSNALARLKPGAAKAGLIIDLPPRDRAGRKVRVWRAGQERMAPQVHTQIPGPLF